MPADLSTQAEGQGWQEAVTAPNTHVGWPAASGVCVADACSATTAGGEADACGATTATGKNADPAAFTLSVTREEPWSSSSDSYRGSSS